MQAYAVIRLFSIFPFYQTDDMYTLGEGDLGLQYFGDFFQLLQYTTCCCLAKSTPEAEFLDEIQAKVLRVFLLAIHCHLYSGVAT